MLSPVQCAVTRWIAPFVLITGVLAGLWPTAAVPAPEQLLALCADCHGDGGVSADPDVPILAGQAYTVIEDNLLAFRDHQRRCTETPFRHGDRTRSPTSMCEIAGSLSDDDIAALAEHFESLAWAPATQAFDPARAEAGRAVHAAAGCAACHGENAAESLGLACRLAGQWTPYLRQAFDDIRGEARFAPAIMAEAIADLKDEDIENLLHFYASQAR